MDSTLNEKELGPADESLSRLQEALSKLTQESESRPSDSQTTAKNTFRPHAAEDPGSRILPRGWVLRGFAGLLLAAGIGVVAFTWLVPSGDAAKTAPPQTVPAQTTAVQQAPPKQALSQPANVVQSVPDAAATSAELTSLLQSMARDLASMGKEIEQLKAGRDLIVRENAKLSDQFKANQEQLTRAAAGLSEQLRASQEQQTRDNANVVGQIKGVQDQMTGVVSRVSELNAAPKMAAAPPRPAAPTVRKPVPTLSPAQAATQPKPEKPKLSSTSRPPAPVR